MFRQGLEFFHSEVSTIAENCASHIDDTTRLLKSHFLSRLEQPLDNCLKLVKIKRLGDIIIASGG